MLTSAEIDQIAQEILTSAVAQINEMAKGVAFLDTRINEDGELILIYGGTGDFGAFLCDYKPIEAIQRIVIECERMVEALRIRHTDDTGKVVNRDLNWLVLPSGRTESIKLMARGAALYVMFEAGARTAEALNDIVRESRLMGEAVISAALASHFKKRGFDVTADMRTKIEAAAQKVADNRRNVLRAHLSQIPELLAVRGRGRSRKSDRTREIERQEYAAKVEQSYRRLRGLAGKKPKKTEIAIDLKEGGISPHTGNDTRLNALNTKLRRLGIDYDDIVKRVEGELNKNS
jgi:hypothetical protein